jgi:hypothetical protein
MTNVNTTVVYLFEGDTGNLALSNDKTGASLPTGAQLWLLCGTLWDVDLGDETPQALLQIHEHGYCLLREQDSPAFTSLWASTTVQNTTAIERAFQIAMSGAVSSVEAIGASPGFNVNEPDLEKARGAVKKIAGSRSSCAHH